MFRLCLYYVYTQWRIYWGGGGGATPPEQAKHSPRGRLHPPWKMLHPPSKSAIAPLQLFNESTYKIILIFIVCLAEQTTNVSVHHGLCGPMGGSAGQPGPGSADSDQSQGVITLAAIIVINRCVTYMLNIFQTWFVTEYLYAIICYYDCMYVCMYV